MKVQPYIQLLETKSLVLCSQEDTNRKVGYAQEQATECWSLVKNIHNVLCTEAHSSRASDIFAVLFFFFHPLHFVGSRGVCPLTNGPPLLLLWAWLFFHNGLGGVWAKEDADFNCDYGSRKSRTRLGIGLHSRKCVTTR